MSKKLSEEQFQQFVVEQLGKLSTELLDVRGDLTSGIAGVRSELQTGISGLRSELKIGLGAVRKEISEVRVEMQTGFRELRADIAKIEGTLEPLVKAFDADAETLVVHGTRIGRIEEHLGFPKYVEPVEHD